MCNVPNSLKRIEGFYRSSKIVSLALLLNFTVYIILSQRLRIVETFLVHQSYQNGHIYIRVTKQIIVKNAYLSRKLGKTNLMSIKLVFRDMLKK